MSTQIVPRIAAFLHATACDAPRRLISWRRPLGPRACDPWPGRSGEANDGWPVTGEMSGTSRTSGTTETRRTRTAELKRRGDSCQNSENGDYYDSEILGILWPVRVRWRCPAWTSAGGKLFPNWSFPCSVMFRGQIWPAHRSISHPPITDVSQMCPCHFRHINTRVVDLDAGWEASSGGICQVDRGGAGFLFDIVRHHITLQDMQGITTWLELFRKLVRS